MWPGVHPVTLTAYRLATSYRLLFDQRTENLFRRRTFLPAVTSVIISMPPAPRHSTQTAAPAPSA
jgi:hypothetical protein